eukprot:6380243-Ditylum_brightwellii.AAC.1
MHQEVKEAKTAWEEEEGDIVDEEAQGKEDLLGCAPFESSANKKEEVLMTQTMSSKKAIDINTDEEDSDMSMFEPPKEKKKAVKEKEK